MTGRLQGKVAIVTGAGCVGPGWGNGRAMAVRFAQEGARVWAVDIDISGPLRDKFSRNLVVHECQGNARCAATPAKPADMAPARPGSGHRH